MKVLSLLQPWATLVVLGAKKYEVRGWQTAYRGPLLIHASAKKPSQRERAFFAQADYFKTFIEEKKNELLSSTYKKCIYLIKADIKKNLKFVDIINSSMRILINNYPGYFNRLITDMLILLIPIQDKLDEINNNFHVRSEIRCCQLYYNFKEF